MFKKLSTDPYKGTRDFYPEDMAVERYIFDTWSKTAELFGYERYDASILEPSELYKSKGAENEEMVHEQTYTFIDRGEREVTLRPEMTPTVARMVAGRSRELTFPVRWYSIPNLFRYERPQRGRLREHWQLNCDLFGIEDSAADVEVLALAHATLTAFGASSDMFTIRINSRALMEEWYTQTLHLEKDTIRAVTRIVDRMHKMSISAFRSALLEVIDNPDILIKGLGATHPRDLIPNSTLERVFEGLNALGITNAVFDASIARGFDYYTGMVFEITDTSPENSRSMMGGGRYANLTTLFGGTAVTGVGFGLGDVIMRDFLTTHALLPKDIHVTAPTLMVIPTDSAYNIAGQALASEFRTLGVRTAVDITDKKLPKKVRAASDAGARFIIVLGGTEITTHSYTLKNLKTKEEFSGLPVNLAKHLS